MDATASDGDPAAMASVRAGQPTIRALAVDELDRLEPVWLALHDHHVRLAPRLAGMTARSARDSWRRRRANYIRWASDPQTFVLVAEASGQLVGYALVTVGSGYSSWNSGDRLAQLETLAVAPSFRGQGIGERLLAAVQERLEAAGIERIALSAVCANERAHRLYERHGFRRAEIVLVRATRSEREEPVTEHQARRRHMSKTHCEISMSLDGFIAGPNEGVGNPLGDDDGRLHGWMFAESTDDDTAVLEEAYARTGAILMGKRMFDVGVEPWGDPPPFHRPVFVLTHHQREPMPMAGGTTYHFVSGGIQAALELARAAAGGKDVGIWGGADVTRQCLAAGLLDEIQIHLVPIVLGQGLRLFEDFGARRIEFKCIRTIETPAATHLRFQVAK